MIRLRLIFQILSLMILIKRILAKKIGVYQFYAINFRFDDWPALWLETVQLLELHFELASIETYLA